jgi:hypothetical protein
MLHFNRGWELISFWAEFLGWAGMVGCSDVVMW